MKSLASGACRNNFLELPNTSHSACWGPQQHSRLVACICRAVLSGAYSCPPSIVMHIPAMRPTFACPEHFQHLHFDCSVLPRVANVTPPSCADARPGVHEAGGLRGCGCSAQHPAQRQLISAEALPRDKQVPVKAQTACKAYPRARVSEAPAEQANQTQSSGTDTGMPTLPEQPPPRLLMVKPNYGTPKSSSTPPAGYSRRAAAHRSGSGADRRQRPPLAQQPRKHGQQGSAATKRPLPSLALLLKRISRLPPGPPAPDAASTPASALPVSASPSKHPQALTHASTSKGTGTASGRPGHAIPRSPPSQGDGEGGGAGGAPHHLKPQHHVRRGGNGDAATALAGNAAHQLYLLGKLVAAEVQTHGPGARRSRRRSSSSSGGDGGSESSRTSRSGNSDGGGSTRKSSGRSGGEVSNGGHGGGGLPAGLLPGVQQAQVEAAVARLACVLTGREAGAEQAALAGRAAGSLRQGLPPAQQQQAAHQQQGDGVSASQGVPLWALAGPHPHPQPLLVRLGTRQLALAAWALTKV